jgi:Nucleotidyl transferase AbiEii toxin, Type IV TA system
MTTRLKFRAESRLREGFALDRRYAFLMGFPQADKESTILEVARIFDEAGVPYAIMGGVAVQVHTKEPRTTLDLDIALRSKGDIPVKALLAAGFKHEGAFEFSDNWRAPGPLPMRQRTAVQFSADALTSEAVDHAGTVTLEGVDVSVVSPKDLVILKLAAALELRRRKSKRITDYGDIVRLMEEHPGLRRQFPGIQADLSIIRSML